MRSLAVAVALSALCMAVPARHLAATPDSTVGATVDRFVARSAPALTSYRALRHLSATTRAGKMQATLIVRTHLDPQRGFRYEIVEAAGSSMIRERVLIAALETERQVQASGTGSCGALTVDNYEFVGATPTAVVSTASVGGAAEVAESPLVRVELRARRRDTMLIDGAMFLAPDDFDLIRVEGVLVKRPSFWTRKVSVVRRYGRVAGVRVPLAMESTAQVLIVGTSSFSMEYDYEMINEMAVGGDGRGGNGERR